MNRRFVIVCVFIFVLIFQNSIADHIDIFESRIKLFSIEFYKNVAGNTEGNFISSPFITLITLMMTALGSNGKARDQLIRALNFECNDNAILNYLGHFISHLKENKNVEVYEDNKLFIDKTFELRKFYEDIVILKFGAKIERFKRKNGNRVADMINHWSNTKTKGKISNIIKSDDLKHARMVLTNAIYFKANWEKAFNEYLEELPFHRSDGRRVGIRVMCRQGWYNFGEIKHVPATYIEVPFEPTNFNNGFTMYIILPHRIDELDYITEEISSIKFWKLKQQIEEVKLCMPPFRIESTLDLIPILQRRGIYRMYRNTASFSAFLSGKTLRVNKNVQKVFINVNQNGSEVSAITNSVLSSTKNLRVDDKNEYTPVNGNECDAVTIRKSVYGNRRDVSTLAVIRPFMVIIVDEFTGAPLFWARVNDPR